MTWHSSADSLAWSRGHTGRGYLLYDGTVRTWNQDPYHPVDQPDRLQQAGDSSPIALSFEIDPDGGVITEAPTQKVQSVIQADPRLYDAGQKAVFEDDFNLEHYTPKEKAEGRPDYQFIMSSWDITAAESLLPIHMNQGCPRCHSRDVDEETGECLNCGYVIPYDGHEIMQGYDQNGPVPGHKAVGWGPGGAMDDIDFPRDALGEPRFGAWRVIESRYGPHRNRWTGKLCHCGWGRRSLVHTAGLELRRILKAPDKAWRAPEGEAFREMLKDIPDEYDSLLPYLAHRFKKGDVRIGPPREERHYDYQTGEHEIRIRPPEIQYLPYQTAPDESPHSPGWDHRWMNVGVALPRWHEWYEARQHPLRRGVNVMDPQFSVEMIDQKAREHAQALQEAQAKQTWLAAYGHAQPAHVFGPEAGKLKGWQVVPLDAEQAEGDSEALGHCIGNPSYNYHGAIDRGDIQAFSLRDREGYPHVSWHINPSGDGIGHMQGQSGYPNETYRHLISLFNNAKNLPDNDTYEEEIDDPDAEDASFTFPEAIDVDDYINYHHPDRYYDYAHENGNIGDRTEFDWETPDWGHVARDYIDHYRHHDHEGFRDALRNHNDEGSFASALGHEVDPTDRDERSVAHAWNSNVRDWRHEVELPPLPVNGVDEYNDAADESDETAPDWDNLAQDYLNEHKYYSQPVGGYTNAPSHYDTFHEHVRNNENFSNHPYEMYEALHNNVDWENPEHDLPVQRWNMAMPEHPIVPPAPEQNPQQMQWEWPGTESEEPPTLRSPWWQAHKSRTTSVAWEWPEPYVEDGWHRCPQCGENAMHSGGHCTHCGYTIPGEGGEIQDMAPYHFDPKYPGMLDPEDVSDVAPWAAMQGPYYGRTSMAYPDALYHVSPASNHDAITDQGLIAHQPGHPMFNPTGWGQGIPGNYAFDNLQDAQGYARIHGKQQPMDIWQINQSGQLPVQQDPESYAIRHNLDYTPMPEEMRPEDFERGTTMGQGADEDPDHTPTWYWYRSKPDDFEGSDEDWHNHDESMLDRGVNPIAWRIPRHVPAQQLQHLETVTPEGVAALPWQEHWMGDYVEGDDASHLAPDPYHWVHWDSPEQYQQAVNEFVDHHKQGGWHLAGEVNGYTNGDTFLAMSLIDGSFEHEDMVAAEQLVEQGATVEQLRDWMLQGVVGRYNRQVLKDAQEWNAIPLEERQRRKEQHDREQLGDAYDMFHGLWEGVEEIRRGEKPEPEQIESAEDDLVDPEMVNWNEIHEHVLSWIEEGQRFDQQQAVNEQAAREQGIGWARKGGDDDDKMRDAFYRFHGAVPDEELESRDDPRAEHKQIVNVPYEHMAQLSGWPQNYTNVSVWDHRFNKAFEKAVQKLIDRTTQAGKPMSREDAEAYLNRRENDFHVQREFPGGKYDTPINMEDPEESAIFANHPDVQGIQQNGFPMRLHELWTDLHHNVSYGQPHPYTETLVQALQQRGYTPEQIQQMMQPQWRWDEELKQRFPVNSPEPPVQQWSDTSADQPGDLYPPQDWTTSSTSRRGDHTSATNWEQETIRPPEVFRTNPGARPSQPVPDNWEDDPQSIYQMIGEAMERGDQDKAQWLYQFLPDTHQPRTSAQPQWCPRCEGKGYIPNEPYRMPGKTLNMSTGEEGEGLWMENGTVTCPRCKGMKILGVGHDILPGDDPVRPYDYQASDEDLNPWGGLAQDYTHRPQDLPPLGPPRHGASEPSTKLSPAVELREWLADLTDLEGPPSIHHDSEQDFISAPAVSPANDLPYYPPAHVPSEIKQSSTIREWPMPQDERPHGSFMPRRPLYYDRDADAVHVGPWGATHSQLARSIVHDWQAKGLGLGDNTVGGWLGYDAQGKGYDGGDTDTSYGGWYGQQELPPQVHDAIEQAYPSAGYSTGRRAKQSTMTLPQEIRAWEQVGLDGDPNDVVGHLPNGYTVRRHPYADTVNAVGDFMQNCWQERSQDRTDDEAGKGFIPHSMHDEHGLPRAAFYVANNPRIAEGKSTLSEIFGMRNRELEPQYARPLADWAESQGHLINSRDPQVWADGHIDDMESGVFARAAAPKQAMAERSGFPELDQAIEEFMQANPEIEELRDPQNAWGRCEEIAKQCAAFLKQRGFRAYAPSDDLHAFDGYENAQDSAAIGAGDFSYPEHAVVEVYGLRPNNVNNVFIDFTASQYGFTEFPKIHGGKFGSTRTAASQTMYHVAPAAAKDSITQYGLDPRRAPDPTQRSQDPDDPLHGAQHEDGPRAPGVWLYSNLDDAQGWRQHLEQWEPQHIYEVAGPHDVIEDPFISTENGYYSRQPVPPHRVRRMGSIRTADSPINQADATNDALGKPPALIPSRQGDPDYLHDVPCQHCQKLHRPDQPCPDSSVSQWKAQERAWYDRDPNALHSEPNGHDQVDLSKVASGQPTTSWHLTDNPQFALDPNHVPQDNTFAIQQRTQPGLYTGDPNYWFSHPQYHYMRPFAAEIEHPPVDAGRWGGENFIPAEQFPQSTVKRVIPIDHYVREEYGEPGHIESYFGESPEIPKPYHYQGPDVREMSPEQAQHYVDRTKEYFRAQHPEAFPANAMCPRCRDHQTVHTHDPNQFYCESCGGRFPFERAEHTSRTGATYYRGSGADRPPIQTGMPEWDQQFFMADRPDYAALYGPNVERINLAPDARILREGSPEARPIFDAAIAKARGEGGHYALHALHEAKRQGYHAVHYRDQSAFGTVLLDPSQIAHRGPHTHQGATQSWEFGDRDDALSFIQESVPDGHGVDDYESDEGDAYTLRAHRGDIAVGRLDYNLLPDSTHVRWIDVPEEHRRQGVASGLMNELRRLHPNQEPETNGFTDTGDLFWNAWTQKTSAYDPMNYDPMDPWHWQQGACGTYACALMRHNPALRFGVIDGLASGGFHAFAHDDDYVYDSLGRHPRESYRGLNDWAQPDQVEFDSNPEWFGLPDEEAGSEGSEPHIERALQHIRANHFGHTASMDKLAALRAKYGSAFDEPGHQLFFEPQLPGARYQTPGRGFVHDPTGTVYTWPEEDRIEHNQMIRYKGLDPAHCTRFHIRPSGQINEVATTAEKTYPALQTIFNADPALARANDALA